MDLLTAIVVLPLAGFLINGLLGARLGAGRGDRPGQPSVIVAAEGGILDL